MNKEQAYEILRLDPRRTTVTARDVEKSYHADADADEMMST